MGVCISGRGLLFHLAGGLLALLLSGCTTKQARPDPVFIPPLPATPRYQFLTSINSSLDVEKENRLMTFLTGKRKPPKPLVKPYGVTLHGGTIFVCDSVLAGVVEIDLAAKRFELWQPSGAGAFIKPLNMAVDQAGKRYVADVSGGKVLCFDADRRYLGSFGDPESLKPSGIAVGGGKVYVTNLLKSRIEVHDSNSLEHLFSIPRDPGDEESRLFSPTNLVLDDAQRLYVSDTGGFHVKVFDAEGKILRQFGQAGTRLGQFVRPKGIAVDREQRIYCVDAATEIIQIFDAQNRLLLFLGRTDGANLPLVLPAGIWIDYENVDLFRSYAAPDFEVEYLVLVINQFGERRLSVYGFGTKK